MCSCGRSQSHALGKTSPYLYSSPNLYSSPKHRPKHRPKHTDSDLSSLRVCSRRTYSRPVLFVYRWICSPWRFFSPRVKLSSIKNVKLFGDGCSTLQIRWTLTAMTSDKYFAQLAPTAESSAIMTTTNFSPPQFSGSTSQIHFCDHSEFSPSSLQSIVSQTRLELLFKS